MNAKNIALIVVVILVLILMVQNAEVVTLRILFWTVSMSRIIFIPFLIIIGFAAGFIVANLTGKKRR